MAGLRLSMGLWIILRLGLQLALGRCLCQIRDRVIRYGEIMVVVRPQRTLTLP